jgi:HAD superfamily hydrolase (TIGR01662 family)
MASRAVDIRMMIRAVFFDLGETLLNFGRVDLLAVFRAGARLAHQYLVDMGQPVGDFESYHRRQLRAILWAYYWSLIRGRDFDSLELMARVNRKMGLTARCEDLCRLSLLFYEPVRLLGKPEPGIHEVLRWLKDRGTRLAIVSNTIVPGVTLDDHLRREGLLDSFPHRIYSCDTRYRKPHPRIYQEALRQVGVEAGETVFVGDTLKTDIKGANRVGMISVLKAPDGRAPRGGTRPRYVIAALSELPGVILRHEPAG